MNNTKEKEIIKGLSEKDIHDEIVNVVDEHSGGIKFVELICVLSSHFGRDINDFRGLPDYVEKMCRESKTIKVLDYSSRKLNRQKMFVYTE